MKPALLFENGIVVAFGEEGKRRPGYEGPLKETAPKIFRDFPGTPIITVGAARPIDAKALIRLARR